MAGANVLLVRWAGGWTERAVAGPKRTEAMLSIGATKSLPEAGRVADAQLAHYAQLQRVITVGTVPDETVAEPVAFYTGMHVGDRLSAPDGSSADPDTQVPWRVGAITVQEDNATGIATTTPTLIVPTASPGAQLGIDVGDAIFQAVKKMANGSIFGQSKVAQPPQFRRPLQQLRAGRQAAYAECLIADGSFGDETIEPVLTLEEMPVPPGSVGMVRVTYLPSLFPVPAGAVAEMAGGFGWQATGPVTETIVTIEAVPLGALMGFTVGGGGWYFRDLQPFGGTHFISDISGSPPVVHPFPGDPGCSEALINAGGGDSINFIDPFTVNVGDVYDTVYDGVNMTTALNGTTLFSRAHTNVVVDRGSISLGGEQGVFGGTPDGPLTVTVELR